MHEFDEENLEFDDFIRQKLEKINPPFEESAWQALETELNKFSKPSAFMLFLQFLKSQYFRIATAIVLLLMAYLTWLYLPSSTPSQEEALTSLSSKVQDIEDSSLKDETIQLTEPKNQMAPTDKLAQENSKTKEDKTNGNSSLSKSKIASPLLLDTEELNTYTNINPPPFQNANIHLNQKKEIKSLYQPQFVPNNVSTSTNLSENTKIVSSSDFKLLSPQSLTFGLENPSFPNSKMLSLIPNTNLEQKPRIWHKRRFLVGLNFALEYDQIDLATNHKISPNIGLHLEWILSERLSLSGGLNYTPKNYTVRDLNETETQDLTTVLERQEDGSSFVKILRGANSDILDIPLEINYHIPINNRLRFFVSTGVSSYLFLNQELTESFNFLNLEGKIIREIETKTSSQSFTSFNFAGSLNLGFGAQVRLSDRLFLQLQPYYKHGLQNLGADGLKMNSFGLRSKILFGLGQR